MKNLWRWDFAAKQTTHVAPFNDLRVYLKVLMRRKQTYIHASMYVCIYCDCNLFYHRSLYVLHLLCKRREKLTNCVKHFMFYYRDASDASVVHNRKKKKKKEKKELKICHDFILINLILLQKQNTPNTLHYTCVHKQCHSHSKNSPINVEMTGNMS